MLDSEKIFEYTQDDDPYLDYCLWEYEAKAPSVDKFRSINLLYHSFEVADVELEMVDFCNALREVLGDWRTVWGVKNINGNLSWEFYFYDYNRLSRDVSITRAIEVIKNFTNCDLNINEDCLYFMFSIDIDGGIVTGKKDLEEINVYLGDISEDVSAGICYLLNENGLRLDNLYHFFDAETQMNLISDKVISSLHLKLSDFNIESILMPEFVQCKTIVVANKKHNDGIYFSRINIVQLATFMKMMQYPQEIIQFTLENQTKLDHLVYDVGIDYRMENGQLKYLKSSYYGVF
ncbi:MAG: hypothetical protein HN764_11475 [Gammaproteobacteria bacterium]|jgi:hypothetical protein|nr:hypothetical protein [Gammaproteobacteria bacterium]